MTGTAPAPVTGAPRPLPVWALVAVSGAFALFYAYAVWSALGLLLGQAFGQAGLSGYGWFVLLFATIWPLVVFGGAFAFGWRRRGRELTLAYLTGLVLVAVVWFNVLAHVALNAESFVGS